MDHSGRRPAPRGTSLLSWRAARGYSLTVLAALILYAVVAAGFRVLASPRTNVLSLFNVVVRRVDHYYPLNLAGLSPVLLGLAWTPLLAALTGSAEDRRVWFTLRCSLALAVAGILGEDLERSMLGSVSDYVGIHHGSYYQLFSLGDLYYYQAFVLIPVTFLWIVALAIRRLSLGHST
jgi:hypothetical protein